MPSLRKSRNENNFAEHLSLCCAGSDPPKGGETREKQPARPTEVLSLKERDVISSLAWLIVGSLFGVTAVELGLGTLVEPGPGFFPFLMALCLLALAAVLLVSSLKKKGSPWSWTAVSKHWPGRGGLQRISLTVLFLAVYVAALTCLGFPLTTFLFMLFLFRFILPQKWGTVLLGAGLTTGAAYVVFEVWLKGNLPAGFWG